MLSTSLSFIKLAAKDTIDRGLLLTLLNFVGVTKA